ncbi:MAG TPA: hypothetical protein VK914_10625 [bacterium]|nr:hypothetical protein [bacterium]
MCAPALCFGGQGTRPDGAPTSVPRSVTVQNVKVQWFAKGEEELPAWINARLSVGPMGVVTGTVTETDLDADGTDEDGDPTGFDTNVYDTMDGSLTGLTVGLDALTFTCVGPDKDSGSVVYALRRSATARGGWTLSAAGRNSKGLSYGHNRFPLTADEKKPGVLAVYTAPDADTDSPLPSL